MCSLCSRLRRGVLYRVAGELGATKIALGHHRDDMLATFFLNLFFGGKLKTMPPKLVSDDGRHVVIRPLAYVRERDLARYAELMRVPDHPLQPVRLAGAPAAQAGRRRCCASGRRSIPGRIESIFNALAKVVPSHLMDRALFDFARRARDRHAASPTATSPSTSTRRSSARPSARAARRRRARSSGRADGPVPLGPRRRAPASERAGIGAAVEQHVLADDVAGVRAAQERAGRAELRRRCRSARPGSPSRAGRAARRRATCPRPSRAPPSSRAAGRCRTARAAGC